MTIIPYNDETLTAAINQIYYLNSNLGGTKILEPLSYAQSQLRNLDDDFKSIYGTELSQRIFVLTDGKVPNRREVEQ